MAGASPALPKADSPTSTRRLDSVDVLRGAVMVVMALDHVRDFFSNARFEPTDLSQTTPALFFTRWITHFCAPVFVFLAGTGAFLSAKDKRSLSFFLATRGLWLVALELTLVRFGWLFNVDYHLVVAQVIWAIGWSMVVLAALVWLPVRVVGAIGLAIIALHHVLDGVHAESLGSAAGAWRIVHEQGVYAYAPPFAAYILYPLVPWIGVMAAGYAFGALLKVDAASRRKRLALLGGALTLLFVVLRATNLYGDPSPWTAQPTALYTVLSFLNCTKYPPSLLYLCMTLGPAILVLAVLDGKRGWRPLLVFGRVPLFYYLVHLPVIHGAALVVGYARYGRVLPGLVENPPFAKLPDDWGFGLPVVYLVWLLVVLALLPACWWFAGVKSRSRAAWLGYL